jgi:spermidine dehydrogenase
MSYKDFLLNVAKVDPGVIPFYQTDTHQLFACGIDAVNALDCWVIGLPGFKGMNLPEGPHPRMGYTARGFATKKEEYKFHFPDGNASIARLLLRALIPGMLSGQNVEDIVSAPCDYSMLDRSENKVRVKLSSTVVRVRNLGKPENDKSKGAEVVYSRGDGGMHSATAGAVVMACWNMLLPYVCPELPEAQKEALRYGTKVPLVYTSVAIKNWRAFKKLGIADATCPGMYHCNLWLDRTVNIGKYHSPVSPDEPMILRLIRTPCMPGLPEPAQHKVGRAELLSTSFETFESKIRDQLYRILGPGGFDPARDIDGITVNRWAHGYTYEYNYLFDPEWAPGQAPNEIARKPFGCIYIANADAAAAAYMDQAIDQAHRAVQELSAT